MPSSANQSPPNPLAAKLKAMPDSTMGNVSQFGTRSSRPSIQAAQMSRTATSQTGQRSTIAVQSISRGP